MTKCLMVVPEEVRRSEMLELGNIPVNTYNKSITEELKSNPHITPGACLRIYRDMVLIREFETMLDQIKKLGVYEGIEYRHAGPAHLSIGQEGAAVGECFYLDVEDHIFGSHRSHGEIIAKGLSAIHKLSTQRLQEIMQTYFDGMILRVVESEKSPTPTLKLPADKGGKGAAKPDTTELAIDFLLYGLLAEIFGRETGFNKGMGGSMHAFFPPFGIYPNNAIVGGSADIATGAALYKKIMQAKGIVVANIGDASLGCGPVWEAMAFATMGQYRNLWSEPYRGGLPIVFNFMNNFYGMGGQPIGETMGFDRLARAGAAMNPEKMHAECVDGNNPLALADAYWRKKQVIAEGRGPVFLEVICYRQTGHSPSDQSSYREREEIEMWRRVDPITEFGTKLTSAGVASEDDLKGIWEYAKQKITRICRLAVDLSISPRMKLGAHITLDTFMFSNELEKELPGLARKDDVLMPLEENPRVKQIAKKSRKGIDDAGNVLKEAKAVSYRDAIFEALIHHFYNDSRVVAYGEENRDWGGAFAVYRGMTEALPYHRLFNSPISEAAIIGTAVGFALEGGRPVVELMYCDFMGRAGDEVFNQLPKWQAMSGGYCRMPVVVRVSVGSKYGAQHSQDWTALCAAVPGLKVVFPATPYSAKGLMASALRGSDPVIFFESQRLYDVTEIFNPDGVPATYYTIPLGIPEIIKEGKDLTILTFGATLYRAWEAVQRFEKEFGISVELIDGRCLVPFDYEILIQSIKKTGKLILGSDACENGSFLHTVASKTAQIAFDYLDAPPVVVGARNWIVPPAELEEFYYPMPHWFLDAYHAQIKRLPNYNPTIDFSSQEILSLSKYGVV
ncbi:MAG TPA: thiamine pyrophosphate-dependent enzyme [Candidatus Hydrogenedentes bacterium]|nr:thiamine pyrophosphate-dependent enzyme [Candidatus Hydrogenedentota bacterium]HOL77787.1 thiamine pyrophosphate-dependent enzyme [Candidatus Hydrogenedentota bacterium]HPO86399.1 thiamine pyrophosphate-dependent enzyme [Candidatus Hydrogenedentota bacterium]